MEYTGELYQLSCVYRHFVLNKYAVVRGRFDKRSAGSYYLCAVVLFNISQNSDIINCHKLLPRDVVDQCARYKRGGEGMGMEDERWWRVDRRRGDGVVNQKGEHSR